MALEQRAVDIEEYPDLIPLAEEVSRTHQPRILRRNGKEIARLEPVKKAGSVPPKNSAEDDEAFLRSAGSWKDFDAEAFLKEMRESRDIERPPRAG